MKSWVYNFESASNTCSKRLSTTCVVSHVNIFYGSRVALTIDNDQKSVYLIYLYSYLSKFCLFCRCTVAKRLKIEIRNFVYGVVDPWNLHIQIFNFLWNLHACFSCTWISRFLQIWYFFILYRLANVKSWFLILDVWSISACWML